MSHLLTFHPLVQKDLNEILDFYETEAGAEIADRFESEFREAIESIRNHPRHQPFYLQQRHYRRCKLRTFPHLILYRETKTWVRIMVLKHVKRAPGFGLRRK
jgi:plasmid stabilization system protein ParE